MQFFPAIPTLSPRAYTARFDLSLAVDAPLALGDANSACSEHGSTYFEADHSPVPVVTFLIHCIDA